VIAQRLKIFITAFLLTFSVHVFAANPAQPFLPSDNVQDPNCTPADSNCYVTGTIVNGGNSSGNTLTIGTNDSQALQFETAGISRMAILANGNVGIGTSTPEALLSIASSTIGARTNLSADLIEIFNESANGLSILTTTSGGAGFRAPVVGLNRAAGVSGSPEAIPAAGWRLGALQMGGHNGTSLMAGISLKAYSGEAWTSTSTGAYLVFESTANDSTAMAERMRIHTNGFIGIGSNTPSSRLTVVGQNATSSSLRLESIRASIVAGNILGGLDFASNDSQLTGPGSTTASIQAIANQTHTSSALGTDLVFNTTDVTTLGEKMRILGNGNVGIGTSTPSAKLHVSGLSGSNQSLLEISSSTGASFLNVNAGGMVTMGSTTAARKLYLYSNLSSGAAASIRMEEAGPRIEFVRTLSGTDQKAWEIGLVGAAGGGTGVSSTTLHFSSINDAFQGASRITGLAITRAGNVAIGTTSPSDRLDVFGDVRVGTSGANGCIKDFSGTGFAGTCSSDERLKTNIVDLSGGYLTKMANLRVISYNWNDTAKDLNKVDTAVTNYGLLAQNVEENFPELVVTDSNGYKQVNYSRIPLYLLKAVQELTKKVKGFSDEFRTDKLCVGGTCINEQQLLQLLQNQNAQGSPATAPTPEVEEPVVGTGTSTSSNIVADTTDAATTTTQ